MQAPTNLLRAISCLLLFSFSTSGSATVITFDELEAAGGSLTIHSNPLDIGDFRFNITGGNSGVPIVFQQSSSFYNGSAALGASNSSDLLMTRIDGGVFDLFAIDVDRLFGSTNWFEFTGEYAGGGSITDSFQPNYGLGNQTVLLSGFTNLTSLTLGALDPSGNYNAGLANTGTVDNLRTSAVSVAEPTTLALLSLGMLGLALSRRRVA